MNGAICLRLANEKRMNLSKPVVMGIINTSPNSFYNPCQDVNEALRRAARLLAEGAAILDIGGEATNPMVDIAKNAPSAQQEIERVVPVIEAIKQRFDVLVSVDTSRSEVMHAAVAAGADMINDQRAFHSDDALQAATQCQTPICLMHFFHQGRKPGSGDMGALLQSIKQDLQNSITRCLHAGIARERIIIDPGFGQGNYGKNIAENYYLLANLHEFVALGYPVLIGWSRKSMIGDVLQAAPEHRQFGSIAAETLAVVNGASIIRTHDVKAAVDASKIALHYLAASSVATHQLEPSAL